MISVFGTLYQKISTFVVIFSQFSARRRGQILYLKEQILSPFLKLEPRFWIHLLSPVSNHEFYTYFQYCSFPLFSIPFLNLNIQYNSYCFQYHSYPHFDTISTPVTGPALISLPRIWARN